MSIKFQHSFAFKSILLLAVLPWSIMAQSLEYNWHPEATYTGEPQSIVRNLVLNGVDLTNQLDQTYVDLSTGQRYENGALPVNAGQYTAQVIFPEELGIKDINQPFTINAHEVNVFFNPISLVFGNTPAVTAEDLILLSAAGLPQLPADWENLKQTWTNLLVSDQQLFDFGGLNSSSPVGSTGSVTVNLANLNASNAPNYHFNSPQPGFASVAKATLTITAQPIFHPYSATPAPTPNFIISGFVPGETEASLRASGDLSGEPLVVLAGVNTATDVPNTYTGSVVAAQGSLVATNYVFEFVNADLTILKGNQDVASISNALQLSFRDPDHQLPSNVPNSGLPITWELVGPTGIAQLNPDNTLTALSLGTTAVQATQAGNELYNPAPTVNVTVTVGQAVFDLDAKFPFYIDKTYTASEVYDLSNPDNFKSISSDFSDLLNTSTAIQNNFAINVVFGASENIVSQSGFELTQQNPGPVVVQVTLTNPNFAPSSTFRAIEFTIPPSTDQGGNDGDGDNDDDDNDNGGNGEDDDDSGPTQNVGTGQSISEGKELGGNWFELPWFGLYYWDQASNPNHIYHEDLGWLFIPDDYLTGNPIWMYAYAQLPNGQEMGWLYTQAVGLEYPYLAWQEPASETMQWLWFSQADPNVEDGRFFWHYDQFRFLNVTVGNDTSSPNNNPGANP